MKRVLLIIFGLTVAMTVFGLMVAFTRPIQWPANVRPLEWRKTLGENVLDPVEEAGA